jgi:hypothetical protein
VESRIHLLELPHVVERLDLPCQESFSKWAVDNNWDLELSACCRNIVFLNIGAEKRELDFDSSDRMDGGGTANCGN